MADQAFRQDLDQVLKRASSNGVKAIISSTTSPDEITRALWISEQHPDFVFTSVGANPSQLENDSLEQIRALIHANRAKITGIGEVGLDHHWVRGSEERKRQLQLFEEWIELASELNLPLTVHSRSAGYEALQTVSASGYGRVLMHAYDGKVGHAMQAAEQGVFFSIPASVVHSEQKEKLVRRLPPEKLLLETDAPVLSPVQGERNEPANVILSARKVAALKGMDVEQVAEITTENAVEFFRLPNSSRNPV